MSPLDVPVSLGVIVASVAVVVAWAIGAALWDLITNAVDMPAERDGRFDHQSNPIRDEAEHSRAKYRSHR